MSDIPGQLSLARVTIFNTFVHRIPREEVEWMASLVNDELQKIIVSKGLFRPAKLAYLIAMLAWSGIHHRWWVSSWEAALRGCGHSLHTPRAKQGKGSARRTSETFTKGEIR